MVRGWGQASSVVLRSWAMNKITNVANIFILANFNVEGQWPPNALYISRPILNTWCVAVTVNIRKIYLTWAH